MLLVDTDRPETGLKHQGTCKMVGSKQHVCCRHCNNCLMPRNLWFSLVLGCTLH